jgi:hypothetical protein
MWVRTLIAAIAVVAVPMAVMGARPATKSKRNNSTRKICEVRGETGSRLGGVRVCRTKAEWDEIRSDERAVIERVQNRKVLNGT